jgi:condensin complex subunit 1
MDVDDDEDVFTEEDYDDEDMPIIQGDEVTELLISDDGPNQTPLQTPMKGALETPLQTPLETPMKTPARTPKTPRTVKRTAKKTPKPKKLRKKKHRKSELDMSALTNEQAALAALESNQILHLRLRKKYYAEALNFIRQLEGAMDIVGQLLGSTNKMEALEAMEFFRVAYEYQFDSAEVCIFFGSYRTHPTDIYLSPFDYSDWDQENAAFNLVKGQQCDFRRWEGAQGRTFQVTGML